MEATALTFEGIFLQLVQFTSIGVNQISGI
ncbi:hypothetical protein FHS10_004011 [Mucilaginibacter dorajii]|nr:hypothetical protein [Mucilaginibacter dorajii]